VIGKNDSSATSRTFGISPKPNQIITSGAMATNGSVCEPISSGISALRRTPDASMTADKANPTTIASPKPKTVSLSVARVFVHRAPRFSQPAWRTRAGEGRICGLTPLLVAYSCHAPIPTAMIASAGTHAQRPAGRRPDSPGTWP